MRIGLLAAVICCLAAPAAASPPGQRIGHSSQGRPIVVYRSGNPSGVRILVFGVIHGNERAGRPTSGSCPT